MQIDAPPPEQSEDDEITWDLSQQAKGLRDRAAVFERQAEELLQRADRERRKAARFDQIANHIRTLKSQLKD